MSRDQMKQKSRVGRPNSFIPERTRKVLEAIQEGGTLTRAAQAGGVDYRTLRRWVERGQEVKKGPYWQFCQDLKKAEEAREQTILQNIIDAGQDPRYWQAQAWFLERTHPEKYGRKERHEVTGAGGGPVQATVALMSDEEIEKHFEKIMAKRAGQVAL